MPHKSQRPWFDHAPPLPSFSVLRQNVLVNTVFAHTLNQ